MKINCSGKIVIARYGKIFRGNKVKLISFSLSPNSKSCSVSSMCRARSLKLSEDVILSYSVTCLPSGESTLTSV